MRKNKTPDVYIAAVQRSAVCKANKGAFIHKRPDDLLADIIRGTLAQHSKLNPELIDDVMIGCAMPEAEQGMNIARISALLAGLPNTVPGMTINRFCSSGLQSIAIAADRIAAGNADLILAGGVESMSMIPMGGHKLSGNPRFFDNNEALIGIAYNMGTTAEAVAQRWEITREAQDEFAYHSHQKALNAIKNGWFDQQIIPVDTVSRTPDLIKQQVVEQHKAVRQDEGARADTTLKKLAELKPVFSIDGTVTAGNASQVSDGAGLAIVCSKKALKQHSLTPFARFVGFEVTGVDPKIMGIGPIPAIRKALDRTQLKLSQIDWIELNEAFAAQSLAVIHDLKLDPEKVNPCGGAIALGHPLGATGAILTAKALYGLQRTQGRYGMVTMCIGTGMGAAAIFEKM